MPKDAQIYPKMTSKDDQEMPQRMPSDATKMLRAVQRIPKTNKRMLK